jgi:DNA polymerase-3 subunit epsilon
MTKQIFLDLETTGPDPLKHGIYQIGGVIRCKQQTHEFEFNCDIFAEDEIDPGAFVEAKIISANIASYPDPYEIYQQFVEILSQFVDKFDKRDKLFFINFGAEFDSKFLRRWFESNGDEYYGSWFWHPPVEVQTLAMEYLKNERASMPNFKLITVAKQLGIEVDENFTHTAKYDAKLAMLVYDKVCKNQ